MADFKTQQDFRKGSILRKINEDPTYLSFFLVFDTIDREHSPLFAGPAKEYLLNVLNPDFSQKHADALDNFQKVLLKINKELPWFWQTLSGVDVAMQYKGLEDPWWGADAPSLEIECLEENVELTAIGLMDLYKRACYDFVRWVEVIPRDLRRFRMQVWVSEVRRFQQTTGAKDLGFFDNPDTATVGGTQKKINEDLSLEAKPFVQLQFTHCEFDIDAISAMFADLGKNPETKKPKIAIRWHFVEQINQKLGANLVVEETDSPLTQAAIGQTGELGQYSPFDATQNPQTQDKKSPFIKAPDIDLKSIGKQLEKRTLGKAQDAAENFVGGIQGKVQSTVDSLSGQINGLDNVHGLPTGLAASLLNQAEDSLLSKLLLGNVHGLQGGSTLLDAVQSGSINAIGNQLGGLFGGQDNSGGASRINENIHPDGVDSSPDGFLNQRIHPTGVDSSPDGGLNQNVHE